MSEKFLYVSNDQTQQSKAVDMLCRCFDEWIDFSQQYGKCFPFHEESFIAVDDSENLLGHVGIMPFEIFYDNGKPLKVAGLASVGVTPEARNRNIAHNLCTLAGNWAEKQGFDLMLLYTGAARVYEKSSWECFTPPYTMLKNPEKSSAGCWKKGSELTEKEKAFIKECYQKSPLKSGMVLRSNDAKFFHSWHWMWQNPLNLWQVTENGYSIKIENVIAEIAGSLDRASIKELISGAEYTFLHPEHAANNVLHDLNWQTFEAAASPLCWHGEVAMCKVLNKTINAENIFMPLADKF